MSKQASKPGKHGKLYLWRVTYKDSDNPAFGEDTFLRWAYDKQGVWDAFNDQVNDEGESWEIVKIDPVLDTGPKRLSRETRAPRVVRDFNTLEDLIDHAARELGATHVSGEGPTTKIYFPRSGQHPYEAASVRRKGGYWHADGPGAREGVARLPAGAKALSGAPRSRRAAENVEAGTTKGQRRYVNGWNQVEKGIQVWVSGDEPTRAHITNANDKRRTFAEEAIRFWWGSPLHFNWTDAQNADISRDYTHGLNRAPGATESRVAAPNDAKDVLDGLGKYLEHEGLDAPKEAARIARLIKSAGRSGKKAEAVLEEVNRLIGGHGVEALRDENAYDNYYGDAIAEYVNMGDTYVTTLVYDIRENTFHVTSWGDWYEQYEQSRESEREDEGRLEAPRRGGAETAGKRYAEQQIKSTHFDDWVRDQLIEASKMPEDQVLPLETPNDARVIARNMLQDLERDAKRDPGSARIPQGQEREFWQGFHKYAMDSVPWLADELLTLKRELKQ